MNCTLLWLFLITIQITQGIYIDVPFVHQAPNYCGPAALTMVMKHWKWSGSQHDIARHHLPFPKHGLTGEELKRLAEVEGFRAVVFRGDSSRLRNLIRQGRPIIVAIDASQFSAIRHFVVIVGWDEEEDAWLVHDPAGGPYIRQKRPHFERSWRKVDCWSMLVLPRAD
ncbi:MAG: C39 family peptidase [Acidobacteriota bacterium]